MFVPTRSSLLKNKSQDSCERVFFHTRKRRKSSSTKSSSDLPEETLNPGKKQAENFDLKKLRYEVIKFGSSGFDDSKMKESKMALAVSLGARPPKRKGRNYKEILAEKKKEKDSLGEIKKQNATNMLFKKREMKLKGKKGHEAKGLLKNYGRVKMKKK